MGGVDSLSIPLRFLSRRTGTRDGATTGRDARRTCISRCPSRSTVTFFAMELYCIRWFTVSFLVQLNLRWRDFFFAFTATFAFIIHKNANKCQTFLRKIAKMFTINHILHEFRFFVTVFLRKIVKTVTFSRKIVKNFKTGVILAHFDFFLKLFLKKRSRMIQLSEYL